MRKILLIITTLLLLTGCTNQINEPTKKKEINPEKEEIITYQDTNTTPIGLYKLEGNKLTRLNQITKTLVVEENIDSFQIFPSNEEELTINNAFGTEFHNRWQEYNPDNNIKIGFNIKYKTISNEEISYNILNPMQTFEKWEYLMNYLYDDYINQGKGGYSHLEEKDYNENTLFTTFKMQASYACADITNIKLTVFTYDSEDDFENNEYRGNSKHTLNICITGYEC